MRAAHEAWLTRTGDLGAVPEPELAQRFWPGGTKPATPSPTIEPAGGTFGAPVEVTIRSDVDGASVAYTLDEGADAHWKLYTRPLTIAASATLRARALRRLGRERGRAGPLRCGFGRVSRAVRLFDEDEEARSSIALVGGRSRTSSSSAASSSTP